MNFNRRPVVKRAFVLASAIAAAAIVVTAGSGMHAKRSRALHVTKECSQYNGTVGSFCTITSSNIDAIEPGMNVVYLAVPANGVLDSEIVLSSGHGGATLGHLVLDLGTAQGRVTFAVGTGRFAGFQADVVVSVDSTGVWHWDGTYTVARSDDDD